MRKIFCDICGKEIVKSNETWKHELKANENNKRVSYDRTLEDVCEYCATVVHCCMVMMKEYGWEPDFHEVLESDNLFKKESAEYRLSELKEKF